MFDLLGQMFKGVLRFVRETNFNIFFRNPKREIPQKRPRLPFAHRLNSPSSESDQVPRFLDVLKVFLKVFLSFLKAFYRRVPIRLLSLFVKGIPIRMLNLFAREFFPLC